MAMHAEQPLVRYHVGHWDRVSPVLGLTEWVSSVLSNLTQVRCLPPTGPSRRSRSSLLQAGQYITRPPNLRQVCQNARAKELAQMRMIQERYPHRHVSNLKRPQEDWTPPPGSSEPRAV